MLVLSIIGGEERDVQVIFNNFLIVDMFFSYKINQVRLS